MFYFSFVRSSISLTGESSPPCRNWLRSLDQRTDRPDFPPKSVKMVFFSSCVHRFHLCYLWHVVAAFPVCAFSFHLSTFLFHSVCVLFFLDPSSFQIVFKFHPAQLGLKQLFCFKLDLRHKLNWKPGYPLFRISVSVEIEMWKKISRWFDTDVVCIGT